MLKLKKSQEYWFMKRMSIFLRPCKIKFLVIIICIIISTIISFFQPLIIRDITDKGMVNKDLQVIVYSTLLLMGLVIINQLIEILQANIFSDIHNEVSFSVWNTAFNKLMYIKMDYFNDKNNSEIINHLQTDVESVTSITDRYIVMSISYIFRVISGMAGLTIISWKLTFIVLTLLPINYLVVRAISKLKKKKMEVMIDNYRDYSAWVGDNIDGVKEIKLLNLYYQRLSIFENKQKKLLKNNKENNMLDTYNFSCEVILGWLVNGLLYVLGGYFIINGALTIGGVFSFITYSNYVTGPISSIFNLKYYFSRILPSAKRLFTFLDMDEEFNPDNPIIMLEDDIEIRFRNVSFSYEEKGEILKDINFSVSKGEKVAIIGSNGSGKTTLVNLLLRFIEPSNGVIEIGNKNMKLFSIENYRSLFSVVSQEPYLFFDTILNNINVAGNAYNNKIKKACVQSGASEFIDKLPEKENSMIGRNGAKLSGGEKQKLAVARAIIKDSPIVIMDEATAGYDVESDSYLHDVILNEFVDKTVIMITHRYDNLKGFDRVYRLFEGDLIEISNEKSTSWVN